MSQRSAAQEKQVSRQQLPPLLDRVENEMKAADLWGDAVPLQEAFKSEMPFFYDTMSFEEWVQWVYIVRFREMIQAKLPLPQSSDVSPMAEESFKGYGKNCKGVVAALRAFDCALCLGVKV